MLLSGRVFQCEHCGFSTDSDVNAFQTIGRIRRDVSDLKPAEIGVHSLWTRPIEEAGSH